MNIFNKIKSIKKLYEYYPYRDNDNNQKDSKELKLIKFLKSMSQNFFILSLYIKTFRCWCMQLFNPDIKTDKNVLFWIGVAIRSTLLIFCFSLIVPLMFNKLIPDFVIMAKITLFSIMILYFLRWSTADLKSSFIVVNNNFLKFLVYFIRPSNVLVLISWMIPMIIIYKSPNNFGNLSIAFLVMLIYLFNIYNEIQYSSFSNGLLVLNFVFQKNWKILSMLIILLLVMVLIFSVIVLNIERIYFDPNSGKTSQILEGGVQGWFNSFWLCFITFTTIGYGDITPVTNEARVVIMVSAIFGIAFYSLFTSVIVNGFIQYLDKLKIEEQERMEQKYREAVNELNIQLEKKEISKTIYDVILKKIHNNIKNNKKISKKSIKLKSINRKNLIIKSGK